jgi:hypothetical protein
MMHSDKLIVCVKVGGNILREYADQVLIKYGSEYSIFIKNLNSVRASVSISIDGKNVAGNGEFVVNANSEIEIERFISNNNNESGNKFKFIEMSGAIEEHRGIKADDGIIRIGFKYEKVIVAKTVLHETHIHHHHTHYPRPSPWYPNIVGGLYTSNAISNTVGSAIGDAIGASGTTTCSFASNSVSASAVPSALRGAVGLASSVKAQSLNLNNLKANHPLVNEAGITVEGSKSDQKFVTVASFPLEAEEHVMVLRLLGDVGQHKVEKAVTVKTKLTCGTCGTKNKSSTKFCKECGTAVGAELVS